MRAATAGTAGFAGLASEYRRSLKAPELEEALDLILFRPLGFAVAKLLSRTPITANQVSVGGLIAGLSAGVLLWMSPTHPTVALAVAAYFACAVLDCADGQLARLRRTASPLGYIVDGSIDYAATLAVFAGMTHAVATDHPGRPWPWLLGLAALAAMGWHCAVIDRLRHAWSAHALGKRSDPAAELAQFRAHADTWRRDRVRPGSRALVALYLFYRAGWSRLTPDATRAAPVDDHWPHRNRPVLRLAMIAGPSFHMTSIMVAALSHRLELYLLAAIVIGLAWTTTLLALQHRAAQPGRP